jgi:hypothetical protein
VLAVGAGSGAAGGLAQRLVATGGKSAGTLSDVVVDTTIGGATAGVLRGASVALRNTTARPPVASGRVLGSEAAFRRQYGELGRSSAALPRSNYRPTHFASQRTLDSHFEKHAMEWGAGTLPRADTSTELVHSWLRRQEATFLVMCAQTETCSVTMFALMNLPSEQQMERYAHCFVQPTGPRIGAAK